MAWYVVAVSRHGFMCDSMEATHVRAYSVLVYDGNNFGHPYGRKSLSVVAAMPSTLLHFTVRPILVEIVPFVQNIIFC